MLGREIKFSLASFVFALLFPSQCRKPLPTLDIFRVEHRNGLCVGGVR